MADTYKVDFEKKEVLEFSPEIPYKAFSWKCNCCNTISRYDSRLEHNRKWVTIETHRGNVDICEDCLKKAYEMITETY